MWHTLFHIYGPISIHSYGFMIALGLIVFTILIQKDRRFKQLDLEAHFGSILLVGILAALAGGRLLFVLSHAHMLPTFTDMITPWNGGFSILGAVIVCVPTLAVYLSYCSIPILPFLDLTAIYAPLLQSISRIGCFFAGCCFGKATTFAWGVVYTDPESIAPLHTCIHPSQIYSSLILLGIFSAMYFVLQKKLHKPGQLTFAYLLSISLERYIVDFWRGDRLTISALPEYASHYQYIAMVLFGCAALGFIYVSNRPQRS